MNKTDLDNDNLQRLFSLLFTTIKENIKNLITFSLASLLIGFIYSLFLVPQFKVEAHITSNDNSYSSSSNESAFSDLLGFDEKRTKIDDLVSALTTYKTANVLWEMGYSDIFFKSSFDESSGTYLNNNVPFSQSLQSIILGYEVDKTIGPRQLKNLIKGSIKITKEKDSLLISFTTTEPKIFKTLLEDLLREADNLLKREELAYANSQLDYLSKKVISITEKDIRRSLLDAIKQQHLSIAFLSNDLPYSLNIIEDPYISQNPTSPNLIFIYIIFLFIGFAGRLIYIIYKRLI